MSANSPSVRGRYRVTPCATSTGTITSRFWNFGDASTTNVTTNSVVHTYAAGAYTVMLRAFSPVVMTGMTNVVVSGAAVNGPSLSLVPNVLVPVTVREEMQHRPEFNMSSSTPSGETFTASPRRASW